MDLTRQWDMGAQFSAPLSGAAERTTRGAAIRVGLAVLPQQPAKEALQRERSGPVGAFSHRGRPTGRALPALIPSSVTAVLYQLHIA